LGVVIEVDDLNLLSLNVDIVSEADSFGGIRLGVGKSEK
jgi:hypothetical protein